MSVKPGPGTRWRVTHPGGAASYTIRAAEGKFKGWYLDRGAKAEKLKDVSGKPYWAYRLTLTRKPKRIPKFSIFEVAK
jgi:hypothetical protein